MLLRDTYVSAAPPPSLCSACRFFASVSRATSISVSLIFGPTRTTVGRNDSPRSLSIPGPVCCSRRETISSMAALDGAHTSTCFGGASASARPRWISRSMASALGKG